MKSLSWVPNALTLGNLLGGAVVCWAAASGEFLGQALLWDSAGADMALATQMVAVVWMFAMLCDAFDGWVARKLGADGALGVQLDSLADVVTGGLAPAMVAMRLFQDDGGPGLTWAMFASLGVAAAAAYRLARFNVTAESGDGGNWFEGLPAPAAGIFWMGVMLAWGELQGGPDVLFPVAFAWLGLVVVPLAMVSTRKMWGLKGFGKEPGVDTWRGVLIPTIVGVAAGTWFGLGSVFLAVPLCLLLYLGLAMATTPQGSAG